MDFSSFLDGIPDLTDLELAVLLCLVAREHCLIETERDALDDLEKELRLIAASVFGLSCAVLDCSPDTTVEDFSNGILDPHAMNTGWKYESHRLSTPGGVDLDTHSESYPQGQPTLDRTKSPLPDSNQVVANVVIAKNFNYCPEQVQIQALELLRTNRILARTTVHCTPKTFHFIVLTAADEDIPVTLNCHFRDHIFLSHFHDPNDGFANAEDDTGWMSEDQESTSSVIRKSITTNHAIQTEMIGVLRELSDGVTISAQVSRYMQDVVVFLRLHRAVAGGISPKATNYLNRLVRCLAPLHKIDYATPSLIALAAKKIYRHRIVLATPEYDRSLQYGGDLKAAQEYLSDISSDVVIEEVLAEVEVPVEGQGPRHSRRGPSHGTREVASRFGLFVPAVAALLLLPQPRAVANREPGSKYTQPVRRLTVLRLPALSQEDIDWARKIVAWTCWQIARGIENVKAQVQNMAAWSTKAHLASCLSLKDMRPIHRHNL